MAQSARADAPAMPLELRAAYIAAVQAGAPAAYHAVQDGAVVRADNPAQRFGAELTEQGVQIAPSDEGGWNWSASTVGYGCEDALEPVDSVEPEVADGRVEYRRGEMVEWYVNGPLGLEQGYTLASAPPCRAAGGGLVTVELSAESSLDAVLADGGAAVEWRDEAGQPVLRYTDLYAVDATGRTLPASLSVEGGRVSIHVDDTGAAYPVVIDPLVWNQQQKLLASDGDDQEHFGRSVSISGDTAVVGAYYGRNYTGSGTLVTGAAYVFVRSGSTWTQQQKLVGDDLGDDFGNSVAISGDTILVGAPRDDLSGYNGSGAAYVYVRSGSTWSLQQVLSPSDIATGRGFGNVVALDGDTAIVGMSAYPRGAYVFVRSGSTWTEQQKLVPSRTESDSFGISIAVEGDTALVGAASSGAATTSGGSVYVFVRSGSTWTEQEELVASDAASGDYFGQSVGLSGDTAVVGAPLDESPLNTAGSAYVFVRSGSTWTQEQKLTASDATIGASFGSSVAISGDTVLVGAIGGGASTANTGSAYMFVRSSGVWTEEQEFAASDGASYDNFGQSIAIDGDTAIVGANGDDDNGSSSGSAYVFVLEEQ